MRGLADALVNYFFFFQCPNYINQSGLFKMGLNKLASLFGSSCMYNLLKYVFLHAANKSVFFDIFHASYNIWRFLWQFCRRHACCPAAVQIFRRVCSFCSSSTPCLKKTVHFCFCHNYVKFPRILITFGRCMAKWLKLYAMYAFSTKPDPCHYTDVLNFYLTLDLLQSDCSDLVSKWRGHTVAANFLLRSHCQTFAGCLQTIFCVSTGQRPGASSMRHLSFHGVREKRVDV